MILAFDRDGRVVRKTVHPYFEYYTDFQFYSYAYAEGLEEEAWAQLSNLHG